MSNMKRGWKKNEFSTPDLIWDIKLEGTYVEKRNGKVKEAKVSGTDVKLVYMYMVRCLDIYGDVFPSVATIARHTEMSDRQVQRCLNWLKELKLIQIKHRKIEGKKANDTNLYVIYHPEQIPNLPKLLRGDDTSLGGDGASVGGDDTSPGVMTTRRNGGDDTSENISSSSLNNSSSVSSSSEYKSLNTIWKDCFNEDLEDWEYLSLMKLAELEHIIGQVKLIKEHHDITSIDSPYAFVSKCLKSKKGYKVPTKKSTPKKDVHKKDEPKKLAQKLPRSVAKQMEQQKRPEQEIQQAPVADLEEKRARLKEKLKLMNERLEERQRSNKGQ